MEEGSRGAHTPTQTHTPTHTHTRTQWLLDVKLSVFMEPNLRARPDTGRERDQHLLQQPSLTQDSDRARSPQKRPGGKGQGSDKNADGKQAVQGEDKPAGS